jgi:hypothetical protein
MSDTWTWELTAPDGAAVDRDSVAPTAFPTQSDAESWLGEAWPDLLEGGVGAVTLMRDGVAVYGPMSLEPPQGSGGSW